MLCSFDDKQCECCVTVYEEYCSVLYIANWVEVRPLLSCWASSIKSISIPNYKSLNCCYNNKRKQKVFKGHIIDVARCHQQKTEKKIKQYAYFRMLGLNRVLTLAIFSFRMERDADFLHKKAERATLRVCLREKYRLPKVRVTQCSKGRQSKNNSQRSTSTQVNSIVCWFFISRWI